MRKAAARLIVLGIMSPVLVLGEAAGAQTVVENDPPPASICDEFEPEFGGATCQETEKSVDGAPVPTAAFWRIELFKAQDGGQDARITWGTVPMPVAPGGVIVDESPAAKEARQQGEYTMSQTGLDEQKTATSAAGGASCSLLISNVSFRRDLNKLQATTVQDCHGAFGWQRTSAKFRRSSWSGFRDYTNWMNGPQTFGNYNEVVWRATCRGGGTYDYQLQAQGYASAIGFSPMHYSRTANRYPCGT